MKKNDVAKWQEDENGLMCGDSYKNRMRKKTVEIWVDDRQWRRVGVKGGMESWRNPDKEENKEKMNDGMEKDGWGSGRKAPYR